MNEDTAIKTLKDCGVDLIASLPCDKNKGFTAQIHGCFDVIDLTREEDGVGVCAGAVLAGRKPVVSIQSSGLGNMMNAIMSLTAVYQLPLPIICSWRGVENEAIEAQIPFNSRIPRMLDAFGIPSYVVNTPEEFSVMGEAVKKAFDEGIVTVTLIKPSVWGPAPAPVTEFPSRQEDMELHMTRKFVCPSYKRLDAIREIMSRITPDTAVVSNIGVPSKEVNACGDRDLNFYMLGSYTQASAIGLGLAFCTDRKVVVIDGDGSLLGSSVLPVMASVDPENLTVFCMDNGTFGSTGNQINQAYAHSDLEAAARAYGVKDTMLALSGDDIMEALNKPRKGTRFVRVPITPGNSKSPNITLKGTEIRDRFVKALKN